MLNSQLMSDTTISGLDTGNPLPIQHGSHTPSALFYNQLHESSLLTPPSPVPPANYISSSFEGIAATRSSDIVIVDLCDESDNESEENFLRILHTHDLTQQRQEDDGDDDDDCAIIGSGTRARRYYRSLSIRSRSLSNTISTPTRVTKNIGARKNTPRWGRLYRQMHTPQTRMTRFQQSCLDEEDMLKGLWTMCLRFLQFLFTHQKINKDHESHQKHYWKPSAITKNTFSTIDTW